MFPSSTIKKENKFAPIKTENGTQNLIFKISTKENVFVFRKDNKPVSYVKEYEGYLWSITKKLFMTETEKGFSEHLILDEKTHKKLQPLFGLFPNLYGERIKLFFIKSENNNNSILNIQVVDNDELNGHVQNYLNSKQTPQDSLALIEGNTIEGLSLHPFSSVAKGFEPKTKINIVFHLNNGREPITRVTTVLQAFGIYNICKLKKNNISILIDGEKTQVLDSVSQTEIKIDNKRIFAKKLTDQKISGILFFVDENTTKTQFLNGDIGLEIVGQYHLVSLPVGTWNFIKTNKEQLLNKPICIEYYKNQDYDQVGYKVSNEDGSMRYDSVMAYMSKTKSLKLEADDSTVFQLSSFGTLNVNQTVKTETHSNNRNSFLSSMPKLESIPNPQNMEQDENTTQTHDH